MSQLQISVEGLPPLTEEELTRLKQEWGTPDNLYNPLHREFQFQLDAAATAENARCRYFITPEMDALKTNQRWVGNLTSVNHTHSVFLNPGFSDMKPWIKKAHEQSMLFTDAVVVVIGLISPSTVWWNKYAVFASEIRLLGGKRPQYVKADPRVPESTNSREGAVFIFRHNPLNIPARIWTWDWLGE